ncbi:MAG: hypothetical protein L3J16_00510 [Anaerolineales bacterium]|nr:hypothetical protein [Anaerolineales bacterium]
MNTMKPQAQCACPQLNSKIANRERQLLEHVFADTDNHPGCTCDYHAPRKWEMASSTFLSQLAKDLTVPDLPAPQIVYQALNVLLNQHEGALYGFDKQPIDLFEMVADGEDVFDWAFGGDWGRGMRRLLERAERPFRNQMKSTPKLLMRILLLHYSREIRRCKTLGRCANNSPTQD